MAVRLAKKASEMVRTTSSLVKGAFVKPEACMVAVVIYRCDVQAGDCWCSCAKWLLESAEASRGMV